MSPPDSRRARPREGNAPHADLTDYFSTVSLQGPNSEHAAQVDGALMVVVETQAGRYRRRPFLSLTAAERAVDRALQAGHEATVVLCRLVPACAGGRCGDRARVPMSDHDNMTAALGYAARGWPVFALSATKTPLRNCADCPPHNRDHDGETCTCTTCHGFYAATTNTLSIAAMFATFPGRLVAVRTGEPSGLVVVDVDPRHDGLATLRQLENDGLLPPTHRAVTGGGGLHLLYAHPGGIVHGGANKLGPGVDMKADGGYIVVAPSIHPGTGRPYRWARTHRHTDPAPLHPDLLERLRPTVVAPTAAASAFVKPGGGGRGRLLGVLTRLAEEGHTRNDMLFWAAKKVGVMHHAGALPDLYAAVAALRDVALGIGLTESEVGGRDRGTIGSGLMAVTR